jgi:hypothetical protein
MFLPTGVPLYVVHGKEKMPPAIAMLFMREKKSDYWIFLLLLICKKVLREDLLQRR